MKNKKSLIIISLLALLALSTFIVFRVQAVKDSSSQAKNSDIGLILFYSNGCPHCLNVEKFIEDNKIKEKISFVEKEVSVNRDNALLLTDKAKICGLDTKNIGVPFLWDGIEKNCLMGDTDIIKFFQDKITAK